LGVRSQQLLMKSQVFKDEVLTGTESADQPAEEMSERRDHSRNHIGKIRIQLFAKSFILQVYVLARHRNSLFAAASHHIPGGATPPARSCGTACAISSERPNSWMSTVLRSASPTSVLVRVPSAATRNLRFFPIVRIESGKWRVMKRASLKNPTALVRSARARKKA